MKQSKTLTEITSRFLARHSSIRDCLIDGFINYSAVARAICREAQISRFEGVVVALRRYARFRKKLLRQEAKVLNLVRNVQVTATTHMAVAVLGTLDSHDKVASLKAKMGGQGGTMNVIEGQNSVTIIFRQKFASMVRAEFRSRLKFLSENLVLLSLLFDERLETTPGVVAHIYGLLAHEGINIRGEMSCGPDLMILIDHADFLRSTEVLANASTTVITNERND